MNIAPPLDVDSALLFLNDVFETLSAAICCVNIAPPPKLSLPVAVLFSINEFSITMLTPLARASLAKIAPPSFAVLFAIVELITVK